MCSSTKREKFYAFSTEIRIIIDQYFAPNDNPSQNNISAWPFPIADQINPASWKSFNFSIISFRPGRPPWFMDDAHEWLVSVGCRSVVEARKYICGRQSDSPSFQWTFSWLFYEFPYFFHLAIFLPIHVHVCHQLRMMTRTLSLITAM